MTLLRRRGFLRDVGGCCVTANSREDVVVGLDKAPAAFIGLLKGKNFGKLLVQVANANR
jgi:NADPH-dependent curcumin reductase